MMLFDDMFSTIANIFAKYEEKIHLEASKEYFYVNRDLRGRVAIVWDEAHYKDMPTIMHKQPIDY